MIKTTLYPGVVLEADKQLLDQLRLMRGDNDELIYRLPCQPSMSPDVMFGRFTSGLSFGMILGASMMFFGSLLLGLMR